MAVLPSFFSKLLAVVVVVYGFGRRFALLSFFFSSFLDYVYVVEGVEVFSFVCASYQPSIHLSPLSFLLFSSFVAHNEN
jgi:hypothetical protein